MSRVLKKNRSGSAGRPIGTRAKSGTRTNCGNIWNETFSYSGGGQTTGAFGNLTKNAVSGAYNFNPNYSQTSNRMTSLGSQTPTTTPTGTC